ncbi:hypothetical protein DFP72DRAFT_855336 [Ephemerocybe angulata]|uniref:Uncharacterized protein n=1 Tax=Ephemerocybe angulata TaxID=980116 RepID=A0A8H6LXJ1_9AGAR|nr:hypothetical protein DFP72DRAFT_855336 [Tulosesus angulatus]
MSYLLFGARIVQLGHDTHDLSKEPKGVMGLVTFVTLAELAGVIIIAEHAYQVLCLSVKQFDLVFTVPRSALATPILNGSVPRVSSIPLTLSRYNITPRWDPDRRSHMHSLVYHHHHPTPTRNREVDFEDPSLQALISPSKESIASMLHTIKAHGSELHSGVIWRLIDNCNSEAQKAHRSTPTQDMAYKRMAPISRAAEECHSEIAQISWGLGVRLYLGDCAAFQLDMQSRMLTRQLLVYRKSQSPATRADIDDVGALLFLPLFDVHSGSNLIEVHINFNTGVDQVHMGTSRKGCARCFTYMSWSAETNTPTTQTGEETTRGNRDEGGVSGNPTERRRNAHRGKRNGDVIGA